MPKRPPTLVERLRAAWLQQSPGRTAASSDASAPGRATDPGNQFADRLRAAVAARH